MTDPGERVSPCSAEDLPPEHNEERVRPFITLYGELIFIVSIY